MELNEYLYQKQMSYESLCKRCGACCGALEPDPCSHLDKDINGKYFCRIYDNRLGIRKTVSGRDFRCVLLRDIKDKSWAGSYQCVYKKNNLNGSVL